MQRMDDLRMSPIPKAARLFNLAVAALVFGGMLAFAAWIVASALGRPGLVLVRATGGVILAIAALLLLASVRNEWRSGVPMQRDRTFVIGMALFGIGVTLVVAENVW